MKTKADKSFEERTRYRIRSATAGPRSWYVRYRKAASLRTMLERRHARAALPPAAFTVPRDKGFLVLPPGTFPEVNEIVTAAHHALEETDMQARIDAGHKPFLVSLLKSADITLDSPYMRLALRPEIVRAASEYLGVLPILEYVNVLCSNHVAEAPAKSQLLHCDSDDTTQLKIFVLCTEVDAASGPLTVLAADQSARLRDAVGYRHNRRVTDETLTRVLGSQPDLKEMVGAPGTLCCVDTSRCFHYGSRIQNPPGRRLVVMLQYVTPWAFILPPRFSDATRFRRLAAGATEPWTRAVLGGDLSASV